MAEGDFNVKAIISADTKNFDNGMKKAQTSANNLSNTFGNLSKVITKALSFAGLTVGIKAITDFGKASVKAAESANKSLNILNNTLKVTGATAWTTSEEMVKMSEDIAHSTNYTVGEIQDMQSVLLGFKNITGETFRDASDAITDMATVMGMDLKSAVQTVGKALDDPIKGLDSLKRQGFAFTDQQKEEMKVLVENGEILKAQNMILEELNTTYGGAAKAAQSGFDKQKDAIIEFKETIGNQLLPIMEKWSEESSETFGKLTELVQRIDFASIAAGFEIAADTIKDIIVTIWTNLKELYSGLESIFNDNVNLFDWWKDGIWNALNNVYRIVQDCFGLIKALINGDWKVAWSYAKLTVMRVIDTILDNLSRLMNAFPTVINKLIDGLNELIKGINHVRKILGMEQLDLIKPFKSVDLSALTGLEDKIKEVEKEIEDATGHAADKAIKDMGSVEDRRKKYVKESREENLDLINTSTTTIKKSNEAWDKFYSNLKKKAKNWASVNKEIYSTMKQAFGDTVTTLGENLVGAGNGFEDFAGVALEALAQVLSSLGAQLAAIAAVKAMAYSYGEAVAAAAASAAAFTAAGVASGLAKNLTKTADKVDNLVASLKNFNSSSAEVIKRIKQLRESLNSLTSGSQYTTASYYSELTTAQKLYEGYVESISILEEKIEESWALLRPDEAEFARKHGRYDANYLAMVGDLNKTKKDLENLSEYMTTLLTKVLNNIKEQNDAIISQVSSYKLLYSSVDDMKNYYEKVESLQEKYSKESSNWLSDLTNKLLFQGEKLLLDLQYRDAIKKYQILIEEQKTSILSSLNSLVQSLTKSGANIGDAIITSLIDGGTKKDFLTSMKDYIRENLLKLAVYTESFQDKLAEVGTKLTAALLGGGSVKDIRKELEDLWDTASKQAEQAEAIIAEAFGDIQGVVEEAAGGVDESLGKIEKKLSSFTEAMNRFKEEVSDLGGDLAGNLIDGLSAGLSQGEFLEDMKKWIRKMLVQSVVYTESMKAEIEAIGQAISKGISEGFTETSFHEIRRDLSWVFNQANQTIEGIDNILNSVFGGGYATGTNNATSGLHLVGEAGPELVKFRGGEQVLNAADTNKALSGMGKTINQNITFNNLQDTTAFAMMNQLKQYNRQMAINGVI